MAFNIVINQQASSRVSDKVTPEEKIEKSYTTRKEKKDPSSLLIVTQEKIRFMKEECKTEVNWNNLNA